MNEILLALGDVAAVWGNALLRAGLQGGAAILLVVALTALMPRLSPDVRSWLWRLAFLKLLVALFWSTPVDLRLLAAPSPRLPAGLLSRDPAAAPYPRSWLLGARGRSLAAGKVPVPPLARRTLAVPEARPVSRLRLPGPDVWLLLLWSLGVLVCLRRMLADWRRARDIRRRCLPHPDAQLAQTLVRLSERLRVRPVPSLLLSEEVSSPLLLGAGRPAVVLPGAALQGSVPEEQELALAHELAHLKRGDLLWGWLDAAAGVLFFFHPLVWLARREARLAGEMAADALALRATAAAPAPYGAMLVRLAAAASRRFEASPSLPHGFPVAGESPQVLKRRLSMLRHLTLAPTGRNCPLPGARAALVLAALALLCLVPWRVTAGSLAPAPRGTAAASPASENADTAKRSFEALEPRAEEPPEAAPGGDRELPPGAAQPAAEESPAAPAGSARPTGDDRVAERWEDVLLLEALRYLKVAPWQMQQVLPLARTSDSRLKAAREQEQKILAAIARIAEQNREALLNDRPGPRQGDALMLDRAMRQKRAAAEDEIVRYVAPRLVRILTREQIARAFFLSLGEPVRGPDEVISAALLDPSAGFVVNLQPREQPQDAAYAGRLQERWNQIRDEYAQNLLAQRYPPDVMKQLGASSGSRQFALNKVSSGRFLTTVLDLSRSEVALDFVNVPPGDAGGAADPAEPEAVRAARRDLQALQEHPDQLTKQAMERASESDLADALRLLVRRMFLSPRLLPVLQARLHRDD